MLADQLAIGVYVATGDLPVTETYGLRALVRRAAVSAATNLVEGCSRDSDREFVRFLGVALGSTREVIYLIDLAHRLKLLAAKEASELSTLGGRTAAAIAGLKNAVKARYKAS